MNYSVNELLNDKGVCRAAPGIARVAERWDHGVFYF